MTSANQYFPQVPERAQCDARGGDRVEHRAQRAAGRAPLQAGRAHQPVQGDRDLAQRAHRRQAGLQSLAPASTG